MDACIALEEQYGARNYSPLPVVITRGQGAWVWDKQEKKYLDCVSAFSAVNFGHAHPRLLQALRAQAEKIAIPSRAFYNDQLGPFLKKLCEMAGMEMALPMTTGSEAAETAIKAARRWGYRVKKIPHNRAEIIVAEKNFHGRTTTLVGFSSVEAYKEDFGPFASGFKTIPFGSTQALEEAITPHTCAFLVEPYQGEAGIIIPPEGWLKEVSAICKRHRVLLILDEVQTGLGRTGKTFAFQHEQVRPDGLILGKSLGGGLLPVSAFLTTSEVMELLTLGSHGSTFGGNALAAAVGLEALHVLQEEKLAERSAELGSHFLKQIQNLSSPLLTAVRGKGLWVALVVDPAKVSGRLLCEKLMEKGVLTKETHKVTIRLAPPLVITREELDIAIATIASVLKELA